MNYPRTHQLTEDGEVAGIGQERAGERSSVHAGEDAGERAWRDAPLRGAQRSDVLIAELRERHTAAKGPSDGKQSQISPLTRRIQWKLAESLAES